MSEREQNQSVTKRSSEENGRSVCLLACGQAGINILDQFVMHGSLRAEALALDTDMLTIEASVAKNKELLGLKVARGLGCMGDFNRANQIWRTESAPVEKMLRGRREIIILVGLGGASGSAFALESAKMAQAAGVRVLVLALLPFSFEISSRQEIALRVLKELRSVADVVITLANERALLWPTSLQNIRQSYHLYNQLLAQGLESLLQILLAPGLTPLEYADLQALFSPERRGDLAENCWIGTGVVALSEGMEALLVKTLESPLLAHPSAWEQADSCLACLSTGRNLPLPELQKLTKVLQKRLGGRMSIRLGAKLDSAAQENMQLTLLMANTKGVFPDLLQPQSTKIPVAAEVLVVPIESSMAAASVVEHQVQLEMKSTPVPVKTKVPTEKRIKSKPKVEAIVDEESPQESISEAFVTEVVPVSNGKKGVEETARKKSNKQEELPFENNRGRFDKTFETMYRGENLDQPTYRRLKLAIKL